MASLFLQPRTNGASHHGDDAVRAGIVVPFVLACLLTLARAYARFFIIKNWGWDDSTILVAWLANLVAVVLWCLVVSYGPATPQGGLIQFVGTLFYELGIFVSQISVLLFYLRLLPRGGRVHFWTKVSLVVVSGLCITSLLCTIFLCDSVTGLLPYNPSVACVPPTPLLFTGTACVAIIDIGLMAIIIPVMLQLQLPRRQRIGLMGIMSGGVIVIIASIVRVILLIKAPSDVSFFLICSCVQLSLGIFCAAAPGTVPLWRKLSPQLISSLIDGTASDIHGPRTSTRTRTRVVEGAMELDGRAQSVIKSSAHRGRARSQQKKTWFSGPRDDESQEDVLPAGGTGIFKTSEVAFTETTVEGSDEERGNVHR